MPNMNDLLRQAQVMQNKVLKLQQEMAEKTVETSAGGGMVKVVCNGKKVISSISIDPKAVDPDDVEMLEDLIVAAINDAYLVADEEYEDKMGMFGGMI